MAFSSTSTTKFEEHRSCLLFPPLTSINALVFLMRAEGESRRRRRRRQQQRQGRRRPIAFRNIDRVVVDRSALPSSRFLFQNRKKRVTYRSTQEFIAPKSKKRGPPRNGRRRRSVFIVCCFTFSLFVHFVHHPRSSARHAVMSNCIAANATPAEKAAARERAKQRAAAGIENIECRFCALVVLHDPVIVPCAERAKSAERHRV